MYFCVWIDFINTFYSLILPYIGEYCVNFGAGTVTWITELATFIKLAIPGRKWPYRHTGGVPSHFHESGKAPFSLFGTFPRRKAGF